MRQIEEYMDYVARHSSDAVIYEQTAEECVELAKACMKVSRVLRG